MPPTAHISAAPDAHALHARLTSVLSGLAFPARRWQVVAECDLYGCDAVSRALLERLPERTYASLNDLVGVLAAVLAGRPVPAPGPLGVAPAGSRPTRAQRSGSGGAAAGRPGAIAARRRPVRAPGAA